LTAPSFVKCEQLITISKSRLESRIGRLTAADMAQVARALRIIMDL
jgi:mRNA-degrading endonuclease toxin of MazEF toxin-antitoxin module